jgi:EAL domain-containing protein (putative c-di-GMP-specific phosphodiesterase class I)/FixJ family two-component response regulator
MKCEKARLLIIDDEAGVRNVLHEFLTPSYHCSSADSAAGALALMGCQPFDLIISDINMPQMSGLEMMSHIAETSPDSLVIMISGQRTIEVAIEAMRAGAFDYITKPFDLAEVKTSVDRALDHLEQTRNRSVAVRETTASQDLRHAIKLDELLVHYQPKVIIGTGEIIGVEALVRWQHPHFGMLPPSEFIPAAEESGLIVEVGNFVLRNACAQLKRWQNAGATSLNVAVNVSPKQFREGSLLEVVMGALNQSGLNAESLHLELTETSMIEDADCVLQVLTKLREIGVKVAIDDFGTGYSSLSYLKRLPIDFLKLDQSFVAGATTNPDDAALVMAIITLAHNLRLRVIAEGIETDDQLKFLRLLRCDEGQGYLFGRPGPADFMPFLSPLLPDSPAPESLKPMMARTARAAAQPGFSW